MTKLAAPSRPKAFLHPVLVRKAASEPMITNCPVALPDTATLLAIPRRRSNHRVIITPTTGLPVAACPIANRPP